MQSRKPDDYAAVEPQVAMGDNFVLKKHLLIIGGTLSLGLGVLGMFLPVLPTTPFLLLTVYCYVRSSPRLYEWIIRHRIFGEYLRNYLEYHAISVRAKVISLVGLWASLTVSFILVESLVVRIVLILVGLGVSLHLFLLKTPPNPPCETDARSRETCAPEKP